MIIYDSIIVYIYMIIYDGIIVYIYMIIYDGIIVYVYIYIMYTHHDLSIVASFLQSKHNS